MRKPILDLAERLENNHRWGAGKVLEQWVNQQPWRVLTAHMACNLAQIIFQYM